MVEIGGRHLLIIAGPCSVESMAQMSVVAAGVRQAGATVLRGGAFKPRTSPYSFQGLEEKGLHYLRSAADQEGLLAISEVLSPSDVEMVSAYVDILQVGSRNMQNFALLKALGRTRKPVLLKRGHAATYHELLMAAEYIVQGGNEEVILCERGIRTFEPTTRNTLDLAAVPALKARSRFPVVVDPSHGTGKRELVQPLALAAVAAGADGLMVEVHPEPDLSVSDAEQTLSIQAFKELMDALVPVAQSVRRDVLNENLTLSV